MKHSVFININNAHAGSISRSHENIQFKIVYSKHNNSLTNIRRDLYNK